MRTSSPALIRCGWGLERNRNGGNAAMAVLALPAVGGKFGVRGGGYSMSNSASWNIDRTWIDAPEPDTRLVNMNHLGRALDRIRRSAGQRAVRLQLQSGGDRSRPAAGHQRPRARGPVHRRLRAGDDRHGALRRRAAAGTTFLEGYDFAKGYGPISLDLGRPVIDAVGEARPNADVFGDLCTRLGLLKPERTVGRAGPDGRRCSTAFRPLLATALRDGHMAAPPYGPAPVQFVDVFPNTPDQKVHLFPAALDASTPIGLYRYQPDPADRTLSAGAHLSCQRADDQLDPRRAAAPRRQAADASRRCARARPGGERCGADLQRAGRGALPADRRAVDPAGDGEPAEGDLAPSTRNNATGTALVPDTLTDIGEGACFNDARVQVASLANA